MAYRYLGVWNVGTVLRPLTQKEGEAAENDPATLPRNRWQTLTCCHATVSCPG